MPSDLENITDFSFSLVHKIKIMMVSTLRVVRINKQISVICMA